MKYRNPQLRRNGAGKRNFKRRERKVSSGTLTREICQYEYSTAIETRVTYYQEANYTLAMPLEKKDLEDTNQRNHAL
jgi:hypothetical protein